MLSSAGHWIKAPFTRLVAGLPNTGAMTAERGDCPKPVRRSQRLSSAHRIPKFEGNSTLHQNRMERRWKNHPIGTATFYSIGTAQRKIRRLDDYANKRNAS